MEASVRVDRRSLLVGCLASAGGEAVSFNFAQANPVVVGGASFFATAVTWMGYVSNIWGAKEAAVGIYDWLTGAKKETTARETAQACGTGAALHKTEIINNIYSYNYFDSDEPSLFFRKADRGFSWISSAGSNAFHLNDGIAIAMGRLVQHLGESGFERKKIIGFTRPYKFSSSPAVRKLDRLMAEHSYSLYAPHGLVQLKWIFDVTDLQDAPLYEFRVEDDSGKQRTQSAGWR
jgi:hypothetical protein